MECNKDSSGVLAVRPSWNTIHLGSSREELLLLLEHLLTQVIIREGPHAKYHYMICGVQGSFGVLIFLSRTVLMASLAGDFTRGLVYNPPRTLWTRGLKVNPTHPFLGHTGRP